MNVLILTPDAVGSTLLQRLITVYMQFHTYDRPVINIHELTNGLVKYHNEHFDQEVLGKKIGKWGYYQSLEQVVELLSNADHYKTSRLAHYHIKNRQDPIADQIPFYQYLNENFYIISCRRHNIFEHALSWCLSKITKKLNVYSGKEKIDSFFDLYRNGIEIDPNSLLHTLNGYQDYIYWCNDHFDIANFFYYEEHLPQIERYILNLPIFAQQTKLLTWQDNFGMHFDKWNLCHFLTSDLGTLALDHPEKFALLANQTKTLQGSYADSRLLTSDNAVRDGTEHNIRPGKNTSIVESKQLSQSLIELMPTTHQDFVRENKPTYEKTMNIIDKMVDHGIIINHPPIKKQTLAEKKYLIRNYESLLELYNKWILQNPDLGQPLDNDTLDKFADLERAKWSPITSAVSLADQQRPD